jgi:RecA/RadA recombinase
MVVETTLGTALGIAAIPHAHVYGIYGRLASGKRMVREQPSQSLDVDSSMAQRVVETAPATSVRRL